MKTLFFLFVGFLSFELSAWAAPKANLAPFSEVSSKVADSFCHKMEECSKEKMPTGLCVDQLKNVFLQGNEALPKDKKMDTLETAQLERCIQSITKSTCEALRTAQTLNGCEWIEKLNSPQ